MFNRRSIDARSAKALRNANAEEALRKLEAGMLLDGEGIRDERNFGG
jgi:hypothetical protein